MTTTFYPRPLVLASPTVASAPASCAQMQRPTCIHVVPQGETPGKKVGREVPVSPHTLCAQRETSRSNPRNDGGKSRALEGPEEAGGWTEGREEAAARPRAARGQVGQAEGRSIPKARTGQGRLERTVGSGGQEGQPETRGVTARVPPDAPLHTNGRDSALGLEYQSFG